MFAYCGNNPVNAIDPTGHAFFLVTGAIGAVVGGLIGGIKAANSGGSIWKGALTGAAIGAAVGMGLGAVAGAALAGSALASTSSVAIGVKALATITGGSGIVAGGKMILDNITQTINKVPQVFWSGRGAKDASVQIANSLGGTTLEMTRLGQYLQASNAPISMWKAASANFANVASNIGNSVYSIQSASGVRLGSIWATVEYPLLSNVSINYGVVMADGVIRMMP